MSNFVWLFILTLLRLQQSLARANVTLQIDLGFVGNSKCDDSTYKINVCVGEKQKTCRLLGPQDFYVHAACASHGEQEVVEFLVERVDEPLWLETKVSPISKGHVIQLPPTEAKLTQSQEISIFSDDLLFIVQFRVSYTCVANYFGELCDVYCSADATEYQCSNEGEKICNPEYIKSNATNDCVYDRCRLMPDYCLNGGVCLNREQYSDKTTPICVCPDTHAGLRCGYLNPITIVTSSLTSPQPTTTGIISTTTERIEVKDAAKTSLKHSAAFRLQDRTDHALAQSKLLIGDRSEISKTIATGQLVEDRILWYQVIVFTVIAVCLTVVALLSFLAAGFYVMRFRKKNELIRVQTTDSVGEMRYIDSQNNPVYIKRCSSLDYSPNETYPYSSSVHSFTVMSRPGTAGSPKRGNFPLDIEHELIYTNNQSQSQPLFENNYCPWPPLSLTGTLQRPIKQWDWNNPLPCYDWSPNTINRPIRPMELSLPAEQLSPMETYIHPLTGYPLPSTKINNCLSGCSDNTNTSTLRHQTRCNSMFCKPKSIHHTVDNKEQSTITELTKNNSMGTFGSQVSSGNNCKPFAPPFEFADTTLKVSS